MTLTTIEIDRLLDAYDICRSTPLPEEYGHLASHA
jgi:hypothetical protein